MRANKMRPEYLLEVLENSTLDKHDCAVCRATKEEMMRWLRTQLDG
jgi:hypothetical protein